MAAKVKKQGTPASKSQSKSKTKEEAAKKKSATKSQSAKKAASDAKAARKSVKTKSAVPATKQKTAASKAKAPAAKTRSTGRKAPPKVAKPKPAAVKSAAKAKRDRKPEAGKKTAVASRAGKKPKPSVSEKAQPARVPAKRERAKPVKENIVADVADASKIDNGAAAQAEAARKKRKYTRRAKKIVAPPVVPKYQGRTGDLFPTKPEAEIVATTSTKKQKLYSQKDLDYFRQIILDKIRDATEELESINERILDPSSGEFHDDDATYSLHMADQGTDAMEREKAFLFAQRERKFISHLNDALQRIKSGNYGICISCTNLIEKGRLEAVPHARMCVSCKNKTKGE